MEQTYKIHHGDSRQVLSQLKADGFLADALMTSPPYFQKRKYGDSDHEIGNEKSAEEYIKELADLFDIAPLQPWASVWVNIGDKRLPDGGLAMVPEQFALEMKRRKWKLVDNVVWAKIWDEDDGSTEGGCMIEPVTTRLNGNGWEYLYRFVRCQPKDAYCDLCAISLPREGVEDVRYLPKELMEVHTSTEGRAPHNVWRTRMGQTSYKHFAVYPESLCERPIAMTCPMWIDAETRQPRRRLVEKVEYDEGRGSRRTFGKYNALPEYDKMTDEDRAKTGRVDAGRSYVAKKPVTIGWSGNDSRAYVPGTVLDPFSGSGTTGAVALKLGRSYVGIDLYDECVKMGTERCADILKSMQDKGLDPRAIAQEEAEQLNYR